MSVQTGACLARVTTARVKSLVLTPSRPPAAAPVLLFLDTPLSASYNPDSAEIAQLVEHLTENQGVASSILALGTSTAVEHPGRGVL
jgi:hypothetical protein